MSRLYWTHGSWCFRINVGPAYTPQVGRPPYILLIPPMFYLIYYHLRRALLLLLGYAYSFPVMTLYSSPSTEYQHPPPKPFLQHPPFRLVAYSPTIFISRTRTQLLSFRLFPAIFAPRLFIYFIATYGLDHVDRRSLQFTASYELWPLLTIYFGTVVSSTSRRIITGGGSFRLARYIVCRDCS